MKKTLLIAVILGMGLAAQADSYFLDQSECDDTKLGLDPHSNTNFWDSGGATYYASMSSRGSTYGGTWHTVVTSTYIVGFADMFTATGASTDQVSIDAATLTIYRHNTGESSTQICVQAITADWLTGEAGTNKTNISGIYYNMADESAWAGAEGFDIGTDTTGTIAQRYFVDGYHEAVTIDVTTIVQEMFDRDVNGGFAIWVYVPEDDTSTYSVMSCTTGGSFGPTLAVDYTVTPEPMTLGLLGLGGLALLKRRRK